MPSDDINRLCDRVKETSFAIHCFHRNGHLGKIYENSLVHRLRKQGIGVKQQYSLSVRDEEGTPLGEFFADLFIENRRSWSSKRHARSRRSISAQLLGYLRSSRIETGLLINFGSPRLHVKKYLVTDAFV